MTLETNRSNREYWNVSADEPQRRCPR
jgi:hypothetical protein